MRLKRAFDVLVSFSALILLLPFFGAIAAAVLLASGRPVFFSHLRVGRNFKTFRLYKFRSMRPGPGIGVTAAGDPRITRVGRILRRTKLDELPQLWNVLRGDMSLVGPRPEAPEFVQKFRPSFARILHLRPGLTDNATLAFRNEEELLARAADPLAFYTENILPTKLEMAERYARERSFGRDLLLLAQTAAHLLHAL